MPNLIVDSPPPPFTASPTSREAWDFLQSCRAIKQWDDLQFTSRIREVATQLDATQTWTPTFDELELGARLAWRNHARCIGRLFWPSLRVRDLRHLSDPHLIHSALLEHLDLGINQGKIQPLISIFAPADPQGPAVRIWNHQLLSYAGYPKPHSHPPSHPHSPPPTLGDPKNSAFTAHALDLGWIPPSPPSPFDLLPIIIQKRHQPPVLFPPPLPHALIVPISHPVYPWFADLHLQWYAAPIISDMSLRIGGIDFPASPFNGWYMGTEIASRDLGDLSRYHLLPKIAAGLHLDLSSPQSLWQDRALLELNIAVLHSFKEAGVRIVDHHRASSEFMEFAQTEIRAGRAVSADWSWIVPPMSSSATPVFHQLWENLQSLPDYLHQPPAWEKFS